MRVTRINGTEVRRYWNDRGYLLGLAGPYAEMEKHGIITFMGCGEPVSPDMWCCVDKEAHILDFVECREEAKLVFMKL